MFGTSKRLERIEETLRELRNAKYDMEAKIDSLKKCAADRHEHRAAIIFVKDPDATQFGAPSLEQLAYKCTTCGHIKD